MRARSVAWLTAIVWLTIARLAYSQDDTAKATAARTIVLLEGSGQAPESAAFLHAVRDHLGDLGVHIVTTRATDAQHGLVATVRAAREAAVREHADCTVWVDLPRAGDIVLYLLEPQTPHLWTRKMRARDETPAAAIERVGLIARWAVAALIEGRQVEMDPDPETVAIATVENPPPAPERAPPPKAPPPQRIMRGSVGASYTGSTFSGDVPWESGLALSVKWRLDWGFVVGAGYRFLLPATIESPMASARVTRHPAELSIGYRSGRDSFFWFTEVGAMLDYTVRSTTAVSPAYDPQPESAHLSVGASPRLGAAWLMAPRIWLTAAVGLDVFFSNSSYIVDGAQNGPAGKPWAARPRADLGMAADLW